MITIMAYYTCSSQNIYDIKYAKIKINKKKKCTLYTHMKNLKDYTIEKSVCALTDDLPWIDTSNGNTP